MYGCHRGLWLVNGSPITSGQGSGSSSSASIQAFVQPATGHHFAGYSNRFWRLLFESKLVPEPLTHQDDWRLPDWGLGLTNIIQRPSAGIDVLKPSEYAAGRKRLAAKVQRYRPHVVALLGVTIYRTLFPEYRGPDESALGCKPSTLIGRPCFCSA